MLGWLRQLFPGSVARQYDTALSGTDLYRSTDFDPFYVLIICPKAPQPTHEHLYPLLDRKVVGVRTLEYVCEHGLEVAHNHTFLYFE